MGAMEDWVLEEMAQRPVDVGSPLRHADLHHAIISKAQSRGLPPEERAKIDMPWNLLKVEHGVHLTKPIPEGIEAAELLYHIYGRGAVRIWYYSIQFKHRPFELP